MGTMSTTMSIVSDIPPFFPMAPGERLRYSLNTSIANEKLYLIRKYTTAKTGTAIQRIYASSDRCWSHGGDYIFQLVYANSQNVTGDICGMDPSFMSETVTCDSMGQPGDAPFVRQRCDDQYGFLVERGVHSWMQLRQFVCCMWRRQPKTTGCCLSNPALHASCGSKHHTRFPCQRNRLRPQHWRRRFSRNNRYIHFSRTWGLSA